MNLLVILICLQIPVVLSAPMLQFLQPYPRISMKPQQSLQQQLMELQTMEQLQQMSFQMNQPRPLLILMPDQTINAKLHSKLNNKDRFDIKSQDDDQSKPKDEEDDLNSVVIDAEPLPILEDQKAILLVPNGRFSIGDFISAIPFLPIEVNVPDTISWAYNGIAEGISGIISIIGSRLPFQRPPEQMPSNNKSLKSIINEMHLRNRNDQRPFVLLPLNGLSRPIVPLQL